MGNRDNTKAARKNASNACKSCRESKIKCDGQQPCRGCSRKKRECIYDSRDDKRRVQLRTAVHILVRRVQQLSKVITEAGEDVPQLNDEDEEFLNRVLDTLGFSDVPPYEAGELVKSDTSGRSSAAPPKQPVSRPAPSLEATASGEQSQSHLDDQQLFRRGDVANDGFPTPTSDDMAGALANIEPHVQPLPPQSNVLGGNVLRDDYISPDWPFPSLDNMLGFDLFDAGNDLPMQFLAEPPVLSIPQQREQEPVRRVDNVLHEDTQSSGDEENSELINLLSARLGSLRLAPDGKLRYFGTASNLHLLESSNRCTENFSLQTPSRIKKERLLEVADLNQIVDVNLEDHLLSLFFTWHNPSSYIVDEEIFYMARQSWFNTGVQNSYYNGVLKDAMCAIGASFGSQCHSSLITYPRSMPQFFSDRAKILLDVHLDSPCVATVQALVLLASFEESSQNIARGWLFGGMAMRIAFDLGLHVDSTEYIAQGVLTTAEARARQVAFWGCYISNLLWSFHLGRPFAMDDSEVTVKKPSGQMNGMWRPYPEASLQSMSAFMPHKFEQPDTTPQIFENWLFLCQNIAAVAHALYSYRSVSKAALQELCEETTTELFTWKEDLPEELQIDPLDLSRIRLPHLIMLHMEYHHLQIFLHRPWTSHHLQPQPSQGPGVHHARFICLTSAQEIARLLRLHELQYSFRFINSEIIRILSSAALILIFATVPLPHKEIDNEMMVHLNTCFRALDELSASFDSAKETRRTLLAIQRRWNDLYGSSPAGTARKRGSVNERDMQKKRVRSREGEVPESPREAATAPP